MRIIYVVPTLNICGGIRIAFEHANRLAKAGMDVYIVSIDGAMKQDWFHDLAAPITSMETVAERDCVVVATFWITVGFVEKFKSFSGARKFYLIQGKEPYFYERQDLKEQVRQTYRKGYKIITIAKSLQRWIKDDFGIEAEYINNALDFEQFHPGEGEEKLPHDKNKKIVLIEGDSNFYYKNIYQGLLALQPLRDKIEIWYLTAQAANIDQTLYDKLWQNPKQEMIRRIYSAADIFFKPTLLEGSPLPVMEAMACKTVVVASNIDGIREYCVDGENAVLCRKGDIRDYRAKVDKLITDDELRHKIAWQGYETAQAKFGWDEPMVKLAKILTSRDKEEKIKEVDFIIKTLKRRESLEKLLFSIVKYYPNANISIADDDKKFDAGYYKDLWQRLFKAGMTKKPIAWNLPFDSGLAFGRNFLVGNTNQKYILLLDDDFVFNEKTQIEKMIDILEADQNVGVVGGLVRQDGQELKFEGKLEIVGDKIIHSSDGDVWQDIGGIKIKKTGCVLNFALFRRDVLEEVPWDEQFKISGEHTDFYLRFNREKWQIAYTKDVEVEHVKIKNEAYAEMRERQDFLKLLFKKYQAIKIVYENGFCINYDSETDTITRKKENYEQATIDQ